MNVEKKFFSRPLPRLETFQAFCRLSSSDDFACEQNADGDDGNAGKLVETMDMLPPQFFGTFGE